MLPRMHLHRRAVQTRLGRVVRQHVLARCLLAESRLADAGGRDIAGAEGGGDADERATLAEEPLRGFADRPADPLVDYVEAGGKRARELALRILRAVVDDDVTAERA